jgi:hypothetical protein
MKSFKSHINEAKTIYRFIKNNINLSDTQKRLIDAFFSNNKQASKKFEKKYGWQSGKALDLNWEDFQEMMGSSKFGRKLLLKSTKIPGSKGKDYWPIRLKEKSFIANIPLNWKTARYMNSCKYGAIDVNYCLGWKNTKEYWHEHVLDEQKVPVYITNGYGKWVVMILPDNKNYEVWDKMNEYDLAQFNREPIPNFNIKQTLIGSYQSKIYDNVRDNIYKSLTPEWVIDIDANVSPDSVYRYDYDSEIILWEDGTWKDGFWLDGVWKKGTWEKGTWVGGYWEKGTGEYGTWEYGTWEDGTWEDGTWEGGTWEKGTWEKGLWYHGHWNNGTWLDGTWKNGFWKRGIWKNGIWEDGFWYNGTWEGGTWEGGEWLGGYDKNGNFHPEGDSPDKW